MEELYKSSNWVSVKHLIQCYVENFISETRIWGVDEELYVVVFVCFVFVFFMNWLKGSVWVALKGDH